LPGKKAGWGRIALLVPAPSPPESLRTLSMRTLLTRIALVITFGLLLAACGEGSAPILPVNNQTTLVYIYTDG